MNLQTLSNQFSIPGVLTFSQTEQGLIRANITTPACTAEFYLHGAHVTQWATHPDSSPFSSSPNALSSARTRPFAVASPSSFPGSELAPRPRTTRVPTVPSHGFARHLRVDPHLRRPRRQRPPRHPSPSAHPTPVVPLGYDQFALVYEINLRHRASPQANRQQSGQQATPLRRSAPHLLLCR